MSVLVNARVREVRSINLSKYLVIPAIVAVQIALLYLLLPVGVHFWRLFTCPC